MGPHSLMVVYVDPLGFIGLRCAGLYKGLRVVGLGFKVSLVEKGLRV